MKKTFFFLYIVFLFFSNANFAQVPNPESDARGVWVYSTGSGISQNNQIGLSNGSNAAINEDFRLYNSDTIVGSSSAPPGTCNVDFPDIYKQSYIKGALMIFSWKKLQPNMPDAYTDKIEYTFFYNQLKDLFFSTDPITGNLTENTNIKGWGLMIWTGSFAPSWLYDVGGTGCISKITQTIDGKPRYYPDYLDKAHHTIDCSDLTRCNSSPNSSRYPDYVTIPAGQSFVNGGSVYKYYDEDRANYAFVNDDYAETPYEWYWRSFMYNILSFLANLRTDLPNGQLPVGQYQVVNQAIKNKLLFIESAEGKTGDLEPWDFSSDAKFDDGTNVYMLTREWQVFVKKSWGWLAKTMYVLNNNNQSPKPFPNLHLMLNAGSGGDIWLKGGTTNSCTTDNCSNCFNSYTDCLAHENIDNEQRPLSYDFTKPSDESMFCWPTSIPATGSDPWRYKNWFNNMYYPDISYVVTPCPYYDYLKNAWRKAGEAGHLYNMNYGQFYNTIFDKLKRNKLGANYSSASGIRFRDECGWASTDINPRCPPPVNGNTTADMETFTDKRAKTAARLFATATSALEFGLDYWTVKSDEIREKCLDNGACVDGLGSKYDLDNAKVFEFFNQHVKDYDDPNVIIDVNATSYAGANATGSFAALKDGLDGNNYSRFTSEDNYSNGNTSANDRNDDINGNSAGEQYCTLIALNRNTAVTNYDNQNAVQPSSDIAQGGANHQYYLVRSQYGAGENDVGWFVTTDNDGGLQEVNIANSNSNTGKIGYYNILGKTAPSSGTVDGTSIFGRFSKGIESSSLSNFGTTTTNHLKSKTQSLYFLIDRNLLSTQMSTAYIAVTYYDGNDYNATGGANSKWNITVNHSLGSYVSSDISRTTNSENWKTVVFKLCNWIPVSPAPQWDIKISNVSGTVKDAIQIGLVEFFRQPPAFNYYTSINNTADPFANAIALNSCTSAPGFTRKSNSIQSGDNLTATNATDGNAINWTLYPNPAGDNTVLHIAAKIEHLQVSLSDVEGKTVYSRSMMNVKEGTELIIPLNNLAKGVYVCKVITDDKISSAKLVVE